MPPAEGDSVGSAPAAPLVCSYCHQPIEPGWYFCPNCGNRLNTAPLSTSALTQTWIYAFSIILPIICFLAVTKWPGQKYYKSEDPKAKAIGTVAWALLILSTVVTLWLAYVWVQQTIQTTQASLNSDLNF